MTLSVTSPVTGQAVTGLTSPTYTLGEDVALTPNALQYGVTALGGTQTGVAVGSVDEPFTCTLVRPISWKTSINMKVGSTPPMNRISVITRKSVQLRDNQDNVVYAVARITTTYDVPVGSQVWDAASLKALESLHIGVLSQKANGIIDTYETGLA